MLRGKGVTYIGRGELRDSAAMRNYITSAIRPTGMDTSQDSFELLRRDGGNGSHLSRQEKPRSQTRLQGLTGTFGRQGRGHRCHLAKKAGRNGDLVPRP